MHRMAQPDFLYWKISFFPTMVTLGGKGISGAAPPPPPGCIRREGASESIPEAVRQAVGQAEEVAEAVGGGYCRLQMPLKLALAVRETVAGRRLGALEGGGGGLGGTPPLLPVHPCPSPLVCNCSNNALESDRTASAFIKTVAGAESGHMPLRRLAVEKLCSGQNSNL